MSHEFAIFANFFCIILKSIFVNNLSLTIVRIPLLFSKSDHEGERGSKIPKILTTWFMNDPKDYAFVHFNTREQAEEAYNNTRNGIYIDGCQVEVAWSKPVDRQIHRERKQLTKALTSGNNV